MRMMESTSYPGHSNPLPPPWTRLDGLAGSEILLEDECGMSERYHHGDGINGDVIHGDGGPMSSVAYYDGASAIRMASGYARHTPSGKVNHLYIASIAMNQFFVLANV